MLHSPWFSTLNVFSQCSSAPALFLCSFWVPLLSLGSSALSMFLCSVSGPLLCLSVFLCNLCGPLLPLCLSTPSALCVPLLSQHSAISIFLPSLSILLSVFQTS